MNKLFICACALSASVVLAAQRPEVTVTSPAQLRDAIGQMGATGGTIVLAGDAWRFGLSDRATHNFYISNHTQSPAHPVNIPLVGCTNLTLRGHGQTLCFEGASIGVLVRDSRNVKLENLHLDWSRPFLTEMRVLRYEKGETVCRIDAARFPYRIENGFFRAMGNGWESDTESAFAFRDDTHEVVERTCDILYKGKMRANADGTVSCAYDFSKCGKGVKQGDVIVLRPRERPYPATVICHATDTVFEDVVIHTAWGMGVICQMSENFTWRGTKSAASLCSGVFPPAGSGRIATLQADATHFSNVKGLVTVENTLFETMMDDAINVHSTCLAITEKLSARSLRCRYMHCQAIGFGVFNVGDTLRFIRGKTLENGAEVRVAAVREEDERAVVLTLAEDVPAGYGVGDAVENADYQCAVTFRGNVVRNNRARGALFTSPKTILVEDNLFDHVSGSAILFAGDAQGWYESGACENVVVRNNRFVNCLTSVFQFCNGILSSYPMIRDIGAQRKCYHRNFRIENNTFETFGVPLLYALSTEGIVWHGNKVNRNESYEGWGKPPFVLEHCPNARIEPEPAVAPASPNAMNPTPVGQALLEGPLAVKTDTFLKRRICEIEGREDVFSEARRAFILRDDDERPWDGQWRGEFWGKSMLSAARAAQYRNDAALKEWIRAECRRLFAARDAVTVKVIGPRACSAGPRVVFRKPAWSAKTDVTRNGDTYTIRFDMTPRILSRTLAPFVTPEPERTNTIKDASDRYAFVTDRDLLGTLPKQPYATIVRGPLLLARAARLGASRKELTSFPSVNGAGYSVSLVPIEAEGVYAPFAVELTKPGAPTLKTKACSCESASDDPAARNGYIFSVRF